MCAPQIVDEFKEEMEEMRKTISNQEEVIKNLKEVIVNIYRPSPLDTQRLSEIFSDTHISSR